MVFLLRRAPRPEPTEIAVAHEGRTFPVALKRRADARRLTLRVSGVTGAVVLTAPVRARFEVVRSFAQAHGGWIAARLARLPERVPLGIGSEVPLRGTPHRVVHSPPRRGETRVVTTEDGDAIAVHGDEAGVPGRVRRFLVAEARHDLAEAVARHCAALGSPARKLSIRDTRSRWGSCSSAGALSFSWRLILAPPFVLDYLAAHEVAHLKELNHSQRFWRIVHELCPGTDESERWLKRHGAALHRFG